MAPLPLTQHPRLAWYRTIKLWLPARHSCSSTLSSTPPASSLASSAVSNILVSSPACCSCEEVLTENQARRRERVPGRRPKLYSPNPGHFRTPCHWQRCRSPCYWPTNCKKKQTTFKSIIFGVEKLHGVALNCGEPLSNRYEQHECNHVNGFTCVTISKLPEISSDCVFF